RIVRRTSTMSSIGGQPNDEDFRRNVPDAEVRVSDGTEEVRLRYSQFDPINGYLAHRDSIPPGFLQAGKSYTVTATAGELTATASTTIPLDSIDRSEVTFTVDERTQDGFTDVDLFVEFPNPPGEDDYFVVTSNRASLRSDGTYSDRRQEGLEDFIHGRDDLEARLQAAPISLFEFNATTVRVCVTDALTFRFLSARNTAFTNGENPFAEATLLPTNVSDGVGLVGGLNCQLFTFRR
ncbi:MAG: DUF4249 family protein, partial [Bacteroidota bacterium]